MGKNNDLWNLLPSLSSMNNKKSDKIPSRALIEKSKNRIMTYWTDLWNEFGENFVNQMIMGLTGNVERDFILVKGIDRLKEKCEYLITIRGNEQFNELRQN